MWGYYRYSTLDSFDICSKWLQYTLSFVLSVPDRPTFAELEKDYPKVTRLWYKSNRESLNVGQKAAVERAYQSRFHIIQGPPGALIKGITKIF